MKRIRYFAPIMLFLILISTIISIENVQANSNEDSIWNENNYTVFETIQLEDCDYTNPNAICTIEVFGYSSINVLQLRTTSRSSSTQNVTCGINVVNNFNQIVGQLSQTSTVTWNDWGTSWNNSTRSASTVNGFYSWSNLSGPSPASGSGYWNSQESIATTGTMKYLGLNWKNFKVETRVSGGTIPGTYWNCSWSEIY